VPYEFRGGKAGVRLKRAYSRKIWVAMRVRLFGQEPYCNFAYSRYELPLKSLSHFSSVTTWPISISSKATPMPIFGWE
jgi:hypothetical protein